MSRRTAAWLAWSLGGVCVALIALGLLLDFVTDDLVPPGLAGELLDPALPVLKRCAVILDLCSFPGLWPRRVERSEASRTMLESKHRRGGPISLTTALGKKGHASLASSQTVIT